MSISSAVTIIFLGIIFCLTNHGANSQNIDNSKLLSAQGKSNNNSPAELSYLDGNDNLNSISMNRKSAQTDTKAAQKIEKAEKLAEADFSRTIEQIPDCANAYWKRGRCKNARWRLLGDPRDLQAAILDFKKAVQLVPASTVARYSLMNAYLHSGQNDLAKAEFENLIKFDPDWQDRKHLKDGRQKEAPTWQ